MSSRVKIIDSIHVYACDDYFAKHCADSMSETELIDLVLSWMTLTGLLKFTVMSTWITVVSATFHLIYLGCDSNVLRVCLVFLRRFHSAYCVVDHHALTDVFRPHKGNCSLSLVTSTSSSPNESCFWQAHKVISLCMVSHGLPVNSPHTRPTKRSFADFYVGYLNKLLKQNVEFLVMWDAITLTTLTHLECRINQSVVWPDCCGEHFISVGCYLESIPLPLQ